jgi:hypothetical protein
MELLWGVRVHSLTPSHTPRNMLCDSRLPSWPATLQTLALVASPRLGLRQNISRSILMVCNQQHAYPFLAQNWNVLDIPHPTTHHQSPLTKPRPLTFFTNALESNTSNHQLPRCECLRNYRLFLFFPAWTCIPSLNIINVFHLGLPCPHSYHHIPCVLYVKVQCALHIFLARLIVNPFDIVAWHAFLFFHS